MLAKNRLLFFSIIGLALLVTVGVLALEQMGIYTLPSRSVERISIQVTVPSTLASWATQNAEAFNARNSDADVQIVSLNGLPALDQYDGAPADSMPEGWIPDATFVAAIALDEGLPFAIENNSVAATDLIWGAFTDRANALDGLDWQTVHDAAVAGNWSQIGGDAQWGNFKLTIASPTQSAEGLGALISAAANYHNTENLTREQLSDSGFTGWMRDTVESVPNFSSLGPDPAESMANRGPSVGDVGFLSEAAWDHAQNAFGRWGGLMTNPARYPISLDYPFLVRTNAETSEKALAQRFADYLDGQVNDLGEGYTSSNGASLGTQIDGGSALTLLRWAERERLGQ